MLESYDLFTLVVDFQGGTYLFQVQGNSVANAVSNWVNSDELGCLEIGDTEEFARWLREEPPVPVEQLKSVWCSSAEVDNELLLINIIATR